jgi:putative Mn2+ efflux pump MntP
MSELVIIAVGLAMDAFAVAICKGLNMRKLDYKQTALIALFFGGLQAGMPLIGWFIGSRFAHYIESIDHWVTFILLAIIGGKMIFEAIKGEYECECCESKLNLKELVALAIATSIDALAAGISINLTKTNIWLASGIIGLITFLLSSISFQIANIFRYLCNICITQN